MADLTKFTAEAIAKAREAAGGALGVDEDLPDPDTREYIDRERTEARRRLFESSVPTLYRSARLTDLDPVHQHRDVIAGWFGSGAQTLMLVGRVGTGKTHAAYAALHDAVEHGARSYGCTLLDLLAVMKPGAAHSPAPKLATQADLFLFDDVATERSTDWAVEQFGGIIDERTREGKRQIITTNSTADELRDRFGPRIMSRLLGGSTVATFTGDDLRKKHW